MTSILIFLLVLSVLIFFHELGHFAAAKACGIYVDRFSIGMPPRIFGIKIGETDYCIGALPIGGYVKMAGQEDAPLSDEQREKEYGDVPPERWFNNKPVWQRFVVLVAGPLMNLVLAVVLYGGVAAVGGEVPEWELSARIGNIDPDSPAANAPLYLFEAGKELDDYSGSPDATGWETGDLVLSLDGRSVRNIQDIAIEAVLGGTETMHHARIQRTDPDGSIIEYISPISPVLLEGEKHPRFGIAPFNTAVLDEIREDSPASKAGLLPGDVIMRADGQYVDRGTFARKMEDVPEGQSVSLAVDRKGETIEVNVEPRTVGRVRGVVLDPADEDGPPVVAAISKELTESSELQRKDRIVTVNGEPATVDRFIEIAEAAPGAPLSIHIERPAVLFGIIQKAEELDLELPVEPVRAIGVALGAKTIYHRVPAMQVVPEAFRQSYLAVERTLLTLKALVQRTVSPKDLGGPVMIFDVTTQAAKAGWGWLVKITAFISINLFIFNLLPIPVLDGGQLVVHGFEGVFRRPLSIRFQERFQQAGLFLIIALMLFVTWNDIERILGNLKP